MTASSLNAARRIIVGVDGSPSSIEALRRAARVATGLGAEMDAVISWDFPSSYGMGAVPVDWSPEADATAVLDGALKTVFGEHRPAGLRAVVREGYAPKVLLDASAGAEMLVVGSRGHGGFVGLLLGSVSAHCAEHANCPVLVVHTNPEVTPS
jgi:nucleotide-binding universal stress UspA family protein